MGVVVRGERECLAVGVEFDMSAEDVSDGTVPDEIGYPVGAGQIGLSVIDDEASGQEKIAGEEQPGLAIVVRDMGWVMSGGWNHVDGAIAEIDLSDAIRPIREAKVFPDMREVGGNNLDIW